MKQSRQQKEAMSQKAKLYWAIGIVVAVLVVALLIFGPKNLPKLGKMFGKTMKNFKEGMDDVDENGDAKPAETKTEEKAEKKDEE
mgnify:CR=1 FL=1